MPSRGFIRKYGISAGGGLAIILTKEQHRRTRTMRKPVNDNLPRDELAKDLRDVRKILKKDGDYTLDVNKKLLEETKNYESKCPNVFGK
ncbi:MAG: hypothetical protein LBC30_01540 [Puniceicoccales bacterium]|jgi:hypothetical protein|nr:hypothetical protein [Puniceicoccales bacterium]